MANTVLTNPILNEAFTKYNTALNEARPKVQGNEAQRDAQTSTIVGLGEITSGLKKLIHANFDIPSAVQKSTSEFLQTIKEEAKVQNSNNPFFKFLKSLQTLISRFQKLPEGSLEVERSF